MCPAEEILGTVAVLFTSFRVFKNSNFKDIEQKASTVMQLSDLFLIPLKADINLNYI
jgi:hypothetical protein